MEGGLCTAALNGGEYKSDFCRATWAVVGEGPRGTYVSGMCPARQRTCSPMGAGQCIAEGPTQRWATAEGKGQKLTREIRATTVVPRPAGLLSLVASSCSL